MLIDLTNAIDLHVHTHPCLFPRLCDDMGAARAALAAGMKGIVLKCHHESTVSRAREVSRQLPELKVFGGIVLNNYVGGINPDAVEAALRLGGKIVWMPTVDADYHARIHGSRGRYDVQEGGRSSSGNGPGGIRICGEDQEVTDQVTEVLTLVAEHDAVLATCHLSPDEIYILVKAARAHGVSKILITHPFFKVPNLSLSQLKELVALGATAEFGYCTISPMWNYATVDKVLGAIKEIGVEHAVLVSDGGQRHNPMPNECLRVFAQCLFERGLSVEQLKRMIVENPKILLGLTA